MSYDAAPKTIANWLTYKKFHRKNHYTFTYVTVAVGVWKYSYRKREHKIEMVIKHYHNNIMFSNEKYEQNTTTVTMNIAVRRIHDKKQNECIK